MPLVTMHISMVSVIYLAFSSYSVGDMHVPAQLSSSESVSTVMKGNKEIETYKCSGRSAIF